MRGLLLIALVLATACGGGGYKGGDDPPDGIWLARISLGTSGNDGQIYAFMVRVSDVQLRLDSGDHLAAGPMSVDALRGAVILEQRNDSIPQELDVRFDTPPNGGGVLPGERIAVYVGGLVDGQPFEYRSDEIEHVQLPVTDEHIATRFDVSSWTTGWSATQFEDAAPHQLNDTVNTTMADQLGQRISHSLKVCATCD